MQTKHMYSLYLGTDFPVTPFQDIATLHRYTANTSILEILSIEICLFKITTAVEVYTVQHP